jgi:transposase InsO family protein
MTEEERYQERKTAIHMLRSGTAVSEVAQQLQRSIPWVYKWRKRFADEGWSGLHSRSRAPQHCPQRLPEDVRSHICQARSELEAVATEQADLTYIGAPAVQARLADQEVLPLPSTASIERVLRAAGMTHPRLAPDATTEMPYPRLQPTAPGQLCQVDIVPHYFRGGEAAACFNAIDVVSRYPTGQATPRRRSCDAQAFLIHVWQTIGLSHYTQVDNEGCFSGGFTHPGVLGKVVRLALYVGTELVFSPVRHPASNGSVERFHQDYNRHVWQRAEFHDCGEVQAHAQRFFAAYRRSRHHSALDGRSPASVHAPPSRPKLVATFKLPKGKLPLTAGHVHFMRRVTAERTVAVLNQTWSVPESDPEQGVWVTLTFDPVEGATLSVYDQAPDDPTRRCLVEHDFELQEPVLPLREEFTPPPSSNAWQQLWAAAIEGLARVSVAVSTMF